jgi:phage terminase large subunit
VIEVPYRFEPRSYQRPVLEAFEEGCRRAALIWHRRASKSTVSVQLVVTWSVEAVGTYFIVTPTYSQGRKIYWDGLTHDGRRLLLGYIPPDLIESASENEMQVVLTNGSVIQIVGADQADRLRGTNPRGVVFDEYSVMPTSEPWDILRPVLAENGGRALFCFTPRGRNHAFDLWEMARTNPEWYTSRLTVADTRRDAEGEDGGPVISEDIVDRERLEGMSEELVQQEFYCSFAAAIHGAYYAKELAQAEAGKRITRVPWESALTVHTAWDLGIGDATAIIFFQAVRNEVRLIDYLEASGEGLPFYAKALKERPYAYGDHHGPHDLRVRELGTGKSRFEQAASLGIRFRVVRNLPIDDGIAAARAMFARCWFDDTKCRGLLRALAEYRKDWSDDKQTFAAKPRHDWASHGADAFRYLALGHREIRETTKPQQRYATKNFDVWTGRARQAAPARGGQ